tara:strand:+ start:440 stop:1357 length:918 start_codon:yes stop_codon:yes gene_type:complete
LTTKNPNLVYLKWVLIFALLIVVILLYKHLRPPQLLNEGFTQKEPFVVKLEEDALDDFYVELYDTLHRVDKRSNSELGHIIQTTSPDTKNSVFLDVGSGTGKYIYELNEAGYQAYGIEKNDNMADYSQKLYPDIEVLSADVMQPIAFEKSTFTHILCTYFTIYYFQDKGQFFKNCYFWMKPGGYLVVHLINKNKFANIIPYEKTYNYREKTKNGCKVEQKTTFKDYDYKGSYEINDKTGKTNFIETMIDNDTGHIRQNEITLYVEDLKTIIDIAKKSGFIFHGKTDMKDLTGDSYQYLYYFERSL